MESGQVQVYFKYLSTKIFIAVLFILIEIGQKQKSNAMVCIFLRGVDHMPGVTGDYNFSLKSTLN